MELRLQPLRIPSGWQVTHNDGLWEVDPDEERVADEDRLWIFKEDLLQMVHPQSHRLLDVGWYPEGNLAEGRYRLVIYEGDFRGRLRHQFETRARLLLVVELERLMADVRDRKL
jgi:hypothetical protein